MTGGRKNSKGEEQRKKKQNKNKTEKASLYFISIMYENPGKARPPFLRCRCPYVEWCRFSLKSKILQKNSIQA